MKALVLTEIGKVELMEVDNPVIKNSTDVILKVTTTAICGSDVHLMRGHINTTPGYILGHEYVGIVVEVGPEVTRFKKGDRVVGAGAPFCGGCENCKKGHIYRCANGGILGSGPEYGGLEGTHAEYVRIPYADTTLVKVPDSLRDEQVLFVGDILSTGYHAVLKANVKPGSNVVIFGAGPVGLCAVAAAKLFYPKNIILVGGNNQYRVDMGKKLGADYTLLTRDGSTPEKIHEITNGTGADAVIEAAGSENAIQNAIRCASIGATISIVGVVGNDVKMPLFEAFMKNLHFEIGLVDLHHMELLMDLIERGIIDTTSLITHTMSLNDIEKAFAMFEKREDNVMKIAIKP